MGLTGDGCGCFTSVGDENAASTVGDEARTAGLQSTSSSESTISGNTHDNDRKPGSDGKACTWWE